MANNPITVPLPQDLPETWATNQVVSPDGVSAGLTPQHGYNYLMQQVNNAQKAAQELGEGIAGLSGDNLPASSDGGETISAELSNKVDGFVREIQAGEDLDDFFSYGSYFITDAASSQIQNVPEQVALQFYVMRADNDDSVARALQIAAPTGIGNSDLWVRRHNNLGWGAWGLFCMAKNPQEYNLQLADGLTGTATYSKTQEGIVHISGWVQNLAQPEQGTPSIIATLPEGFRPQNNVRSVNVVSATAPSLGLARVEISAEGTISLVAWNNVGSLGAGVSIDITFPSAS